MRISVKESGDDTFIPDNEKTEFFFKFLGKEELTTKELNQIVSEQMEVRFEFSKHYATSNICEEEHTCNGIMWYNKDLRSWLGFRQQSGKTFKFFQSNEYRGKSKSDLISKMFYREYARKDE